MLIERVCYIVVTDLHLNSHKQNRYNYFIECLDVIDQIKQIALSIHAKEKNLILLGDEVDRGKTSVDAYDKVLQLLKYLINDFNKTYLVMGNHSKSYSKHNPIYSFIHSFETDTVKSWNVKPLALVPEIEVLDRIEFKDVEFVFRHYGSNTQMISDKVGILFMHDNLYPQEEEHRITYAHNKYIHPIDKFDFIFNGHLHTIRTQWTLGKTQIHNLGSLLRTKAEEVFDSDLVRQIPIIYLEDGYLDTIKMEKITLPPKEIVYKEDEYQEQHEKYILKKDLNEYKEYGKIFQHDIVPLDMLDQSVQATYDIRVRALWSKIKGDLQ